MSIVYFPCPGEGLNRVVDWLTSLLQVDSFSVMLPHVIGNKMDDQYAGSCDLEVGAYGNYAVQ